MAFQADGRELRIGDGDAAGVLAAIEFRADTEAGPTVRRSNQAVPTRNFISSNLGNGGDGHRASEGRVRFSWTEPCWCFLRDRDRSSIVVVAAVGAAPGQLRSPTEFDCLRAVRFKQRLGLMDGVGRLVRPPAVRTDDAARRPAGSPRRGRHSARRSRAGSARPCSAPNACGTVRNTNDRASSVDAGPLR